MRLDKYLKISRLIKRRTVACEACEQGKVTLNGKVAKPSANVDTGDVIAITFGEKVITVRVEKVVEHALKADASDLYTVL